MSEIAFSLVSRERLKSITPLFRVENIVLSPSHGDDSEDWEFSLSSPPLWKQIEVILEKYPDGGQILKELVQNADDAEATEVQFLLDSRPKAYGRETLINREMAHFQGPALYAQNNAVFRPSDWKSIQNLSQSEKAKDPMKVGRFGIGFNSVYHLTDLPSVVSGNKIGFLDPQEKYLKKGGKGCTFSHAATYVDQFAPYNVLGCSMTAPSYEATLFRFPLRRDGDASLLSKSFHTPETIRSILFESFRKDAHLVLLFLKSVASIKLWDWRPESESPEEIFSVCLDEQTRQDVLDARKRINVGIISRNVSVEEAFQAVVTCQDDSQVISIQKWLIVHHISMEHSDIVELGEELHQVPWIGIALSLPPLTAQAADPGRMFCFLPLPPSEDSQTGLPVHVHGSFSVADNRRSLKWPAKDCPNDKGVKWNCLLLEHLVGPAYEALISKAICLSLDHCTVYRAWPEPSDVKVHWKDVLDRFLSTLLRKDVFWTDCGNGSWISLAEAVIHESSERNADERVAYEEMTRIGMPVVHPPRNVFACLYHAKACKPFNSQLLRSSLKKSSHDYVDLSRRAKLRLLEFALKDNNYPDLVGLFLLPVNDGSFVEFESSSSPNDIYIANEKYPLSLFQVLERRFLHCSLLELLRQKLTSPGSCEALSLVHLTSSHVAELIKKILLHFWPLQEAATLLWGDQPSQQWMQDVWKFLSDHKLYDKFVGCFVVPCDNFTSVAKLVCKGNVIFARRDSASIAMSQNVASALRIAGCVVLQDCPYYIYSNDDLTEYVWTQAEALRCLAEVPASVLSLQEWTDIQCQDVLSFLFRVIVSDSPFTSEMKSVLLSMPIFRLYHSRAYTSLENCSTSVPESLRRSDLPLKQSLLLFPDSEQSAILGYLSPSSPHRTLTFEELFTQVVFPHFEEYEVGDKRTIIEYLLDNHRSLTDVVREGMSELSFVPVSDETLKKPSELFLPSTPLVTELFRGKPVFPEGPFSLSTEYGRLLSRVALFRPLESISGGELVEIAVDASDGDMEKGEALLSLFCGKAEYLWAENLLSEPVSSATVAHWLKQIEWCPVECTAPPSYPSALPWKADPCTMALPAEVVCALDCMGVVVEHLSYLVGSSAFIFKGGVVRDECLLNLLGIRLPRLEDIFQHLLNAIKFYETNKKSCGGEFGRMMTMLFFLLPSLIPRCWSLESLKEGFFGNFLDLNAIWVNDTVGFLCANRLAASCDYGGLLEPWLVTICPKEHSHLQSSAIQSALGIKSKFSQSDVLSVLDIMQRSQESGKLFLENRRDLKIVVGILNWITKGVKTVSSELVNKILVPVDHSDGFQLLPCEEVIYCDADWLLSGSHSALADHKVVHKSINDIAFKLGVPSLTSRIAQSEQLDFGFEQVGQNEPLTRRLKNILLEYKDDDDIFKELIQNAEDAGASEVSFLVDWRLGPTSSLLSLGMKHLQGPALWAYNDATFTDKDFANIAKLAARTKESDSNKIGRFGLGFNSVYHLTDVPSFVSRDYVVIFDPHCYHLGNHIKDSSKPGVKIDFVKAPVAESFPDQFQPYESVFGCSISSRKPYEGTLFRLPFRTDIEDQPPSKIKSEAYGKRHVDAALETLRGVGSQLLLFLSHVSCIKVYELCENASSANDRSLLFKITAEKTLFNSKLFPSDLLPFSSSLVAGTDSFTSNLESCCLVSVHLEVEENKKESSDKWLVSACVGQEESRAFAQSEEGKKLGLTPFASVAVRLADDEGRGLIPIEGKVFCFLPLSIATGLSFHVNGFFSVHSNRRDLHRESTESCTGEKGVDALWNEALIKDAVTKATVAMFQALTSLLREDVQLSSYYNLFPRLRLSVPLWNQLAVCFYKTVANQRPAILRTARHEPPQDWIPYEEAVFLSSDVVNNLRHAKTLVSKAISNFVHIPDQCLHVVENLNKLEDGHRNTALLLVESFLDKVFVRASTLLEPSSRDELNGDVLNLVFREGSDSRVCAILKEIHFVPSSPDGKSFCRPSDLVYPGSLTKKLFSLEDGRFPHESFEDKESEFVLTNLLGMKTYDTLNWQDVTERMRNVPSLSQDKVKLRIQAITQLMQNLHRSKSPCGESKISEIRSIPFLPVMERPDDYPLREKWASSVLGRFVAASTAGVFYSESLNHVGACAVVLSVSRSDFLSRCPSVLGILNIQRPTTAQILRQLEVAINYVHDESVSPQLRTLIYDIYSQLNNRVVARELSASSFPLEEFVRSTDCILVGNRFVAPSKLAFEASGSSMYLIQVPSDLQRFEPLLRELGVRSKFEPNDFASALIQMGKDFRERQMTKTETDCAFAFLQQLTSAEKTWRESRRGELEIPLISEKFFLVPASKLTYKDVFWAQNSNDSDRIYVHPEYSLTGQVLCDLGVVPVRNRYLDDHSVDLFNDDFGEEFGQQEPLACRLKNVIKDYPWGVQILKELVQNADDAGASFLHMVYDKGFHSTETVFCDGWKKLQGPALLVYNNRTFSKKDLIGIQNLGLGSKGDDSAKIGQFGIGFNAVYHLTDCPSFISGNEVLCVLDPLCMFIAGSSIKKPGRKFNLNQEFWQKFSDAKNAYYSVFTDDQLSRGTLFRFPLRHKGYSSPTETISEKEVTVDEMEILLKDFADVSSDLLIFLNSVKEIKLSVVDGKEQLEQFSVCAEVEHNAVQDLEKLSEAITAAKNAKKLKTFEVPWFHVTYEMLIAAAEKGSPVSETRWLVLQSIGNGSADDGIERKDFTEEALLPRAGIAARICDTEIKEEGKAFCFLPLPGQIPLPVYVNGHFALDSLRRNLFCETSLTKSSRVCNSKQAWNEDLIDASIAPAYATFLEEAKRYMPSGYCCDLGRVEKQLAWFHSLFPFFSESELSYWSQLSRSVYSFLRRTRSSILAFVDSPLPFDQRLLSDLQCRFGDREVLSYGATLWAGRVLKDQFPARPRLTWYSLGPVEVCGLNFSKALYWSLEEIERRVGKASVIVLKAILLLLGLPVVTTTERIFLSLKSVGEPGVETTGPQSVYNFLYHFDSPLCPCKLSLGKIKDTLLKVPVVADFLLRYLFGLKDECLSLQKLKGIPLSVTSNERLKTFSDDFPVYLSRFPELLPTDPELFVHPVLRDSSLRHFMKIAKATRSICVLSPSVFFDRLRWTELFPLKVLHKYTKEAEMSLPNNWILEFWKYSTTEASFEDVLDWFKGHPVIPATYNSLSVFVPIELGYTVLHVTESPIEPAEEVVIRMGIPVLQRDLVCDKAVDALVKSRIVTFDNPGRVVKALQYLFSNKMCFLRESLDSSASLCLLKYFNSRISSTNLQPTGFSLLELGALSLFETVAGGFQPISSRKCVCLSKDLLDHGSDIWMESEVAVFLKRQPELSTLYKSLGVINKSLVDTYLDFIFPKFRRLTDGDRMKHLLFLKSFPQLHQVLDKLAQTPCFWKKGEFCCVNTFFDPSVKLFSLMLEPEDFPVIPPIALGSEKEEKMEWLTFLRKLGLKQVAPPHLLIQFGKRLERTGRQLSVLPEDWKKKSKCLFLHLINNKYDSWVRDDYALLECLPAEEVERNLAAISEPFRTKITSCRQSVAFSEQNERLCWTLRSLAPKWTETGPRKSSIPIETSPSLQQVVTNVENVVSAYEAANLRSTADETLLEEIQRIILCTLQYFSDTLRHKDTFPDLSVTSNLRDTSIFENCFDANVDAVKKLCRSKFIFIKEKKTFANPLQVVRRSPKELLHLNPYFYELPDVYGMHVDLLRRLGVDTEARPFHCARVLEDICHENDMSQSPSELTDVNDFIKAQSATEWLFRLLDSNQGEGDNVESLSVALKPLYLLNRQSGLTLSSKLVFLDNVQHKSYIHLLERPFLIDLTTCNLSSLHEKTVDLLPESLRPAKASSLFGSVITKDSAVVSSSEQHLTSTERLRFLITSSHFALGIKSLFVHKSRSDKIPSSLEKGLKTISTKLEIKCVESFSTSLVFFANGEEVKDTSKKGDVYLEVSETDDEAVLYITESALGDNISAPAVAVRIRITNCLLCLLQCPSDIDSATVMGMLTLDSPSEIPLYLGSLGISFVSSGQALELRNESRFLKVVCGGEVNPVHMKHIIQDINLDFEINEWVAYEISESKLIYAQIINKLFNREDDFIGDDGLLLSRSRYIIDIGKDEPIEVDCLDLHKFRRRANNLCRDLVSSEGSRLGSPETRSFDEKRAELVKQLEEIRSLPEVDRRKALRRLYLKWHPDKCDDVDANEIFAFLRRQINEMFVHEGNSEGSHPTFRQWDSHASSFPSRPTRMAASRDATFSSDVGDDGDDDNDSFPSFPTPTFSRQPEMGKLFRSQAEADLIAAREIHEVQLEKANGNFALVCFLCHECAEKAFKGVLLMEKGLSSYQRFSHNLRWFFSALDYVPQSAQSTVQESALQLNCYYINTRYPDSLNAVPALFFTRDEAQKALTCAKTIVQSTVL